MPLVNKTIRIKKELIEILEEVSKKSNLSFDQLVTKCFEYSLEHLHDNSMILSTLQHSDEANFDKEYTCCFTGHRVIRKNDIESIKINLRNLTAELINKGITNFICGGALGFDTIAAIEILEQKKNYNDVKLILALPCEGQEKDWKEKQQIVYRNIIYLADKVIYTSKNYTKSCMTKRNNYMVDNSNYCVCYLRNKSGGTFKTFNYAEKQKLNIFML